ncbi:hypothetical protein [Pseudomonas orientalis]|uniref:Uncharacterized protein n=1 Tax=Pseudomonas orientalis TaxID=76758 RepID=A0A1H2FBU3_9PSED|nr:hypothetical protein [Pseudomonas orientalis]KRP64829.1 hypothetical protein TU82_13970 [Pseudomonas orientalis]SDU04755.1 hypothetical protein SAMN04490197_2346 [Pseudomonas orientalis]
MSTPAPIELVSVAGNFTCELTVGSSPSIQFKATTIESRDSGDEQLIETFDDNAHSVVLYLKHGLAVGEHDIKEGDIGVRASCSGEIEGKPFYFQACSGKLYVKSIDLANNEIDATFHFKRDDKLDVTDGVINLNGTKKT